MQRSWHASTGREWLGRATWAPEQHRAETPAQKNWPSVGRELILLLVAMKHHHTAIDTHFVSVACERCFICLYWVDTYHGRARSPHRG